MNAIVMDGSTVAEQLLQETAQQAAEFVEQFGRRPVLATVLCGDDPASHTYVQMKANRCRAVGIESQRHELPATATTIDVIELVRGLSNDPDVDGILVQHPVPLSVDERSVFEAIAPSKDVDGVTYSSFAVMSLGGSGFSSCTPAGIMKLLDAYDISLAGKQAVVVGRSPILGKPVGMLLLARDATVTYCHSKTKNLPALVAEADVVVAAVGRPKLIQGEWIKPGAVVIDAGYNPGNVGDVDFDSALLRAGYLTPVPGGVGPMTIAVLLTQTVEAAQAQAKAAVAR